MTPGDAIGILVHGDNHFIVRGPLPSRAIALRLVQHWSVIQIAGVTPPGLTAWEIQARAFRENLSWAVVTPGEAEHSAAVAVLLGELAARGVPIHDAERESW